MVSCHYSVGTSYCWRTITFNYQLATQNTNKKYITGLTAWAHVNILVLAYSWCGAVWIFFQPYVLYYNCTWPPACLLLLNLSPNKWPGQSISQLVILDQPLQYHNSLWICFIWSPLWHIYSLLGWLLTCRTYRHEFYLEFPSHTIRSVFQSHALEL